MNKSLLTLLAICFAVCSFAQQNKAFPELSGVTVDGKTVTLPASSKGKYTLVGIAFSKRQKRILQAGWTQ